MAFLSALLVAPAACGGGGASTTKGAGGESSSSTHASASSSGAGGSAITADQACSDSAHAICTERDKCSNNFFNDLHYGSEAACETRAKANCLTAAAAPGTGATPKTTETCVAAYPMYTCNQFEDNDPPAACVPQVGMGAMGKPCAFAAQCQSTFCLTGPTTVCGTCQPLPSVGATCQDAADCGRNQACPIPAGATSGACASYVQSGGACDDTHPCDNTLACVGANAAMMTMGMCMAQGSTVGAACDSTRRTAANCDGTLGLACIPNGMGSMGVGTCQAVALVAPGATCGAIGTPTTMVADCQAGGLCVKAVATDKTGTCSAPAADGAACDGDVTKGPGCLAPAKCVPTTPGTTAGTCTLADGTKCM